MYVENHDYLHKQHHNTETSDNLHGYHRSQSVGEEACWEIKAKYKDGRAIEAGMERQELRR